MDILTVSGNEFTQVASIVQSTGIPSAGLIAVLGANGQFDVSVIPGSSGQASTFVFNQSTPSIEWIIVHNLSKYPTVTVVDSGGNLIFGATQYISNNEVIVYFGSAMAGQAFLN